MALGTRLVPHKYKVCWPVGHGNSAVNYLEALIEPTCCYCGASLQLAVHICRMDFFMFVIKYSLISIRATDWSDGMVTKASAVLQCTGPMIDHFCTFAGESQGWSVNDSTVCKRGSLHNLIPCITVEQVWQPWHKVKISTWICESFKHDTQSIGIINMEFAVTCNFVR